MIPIISSSDKAFLELLNNRTVDLDTVDSVVKDIINAVKSGGNEELCKITARLDGVDLKPSGIPVGKDEIQAAYSKVSNDFLIALRIAYQNIFKYHKQQLRNSWIDPHPDGKMLGQLITPLHRVGIYVPGGKASYPSSVLMNAIPAIVAGVQEIVMVTPPNDDGTITPYTLVAAAESGVTEIYRIGGAQAVAALAYGTETIANVDKIVGPGNIYVTAAKRQVFGTVDIDMLAGPSEVLIIADNSARPDFIAADMLAQAEHDEMASAILVTTDIQLAKDVQTELYRQLEKLNRRTVAEKSINERGLIITTASLDEAVDIANSFAPEHLELLLAEPYSWLGRVRHAGAVFLGHYSPEPVGDYMAGPNHVLPTGGTAKFFSPLNVDTFMKKTSVIGYSPESLMREGQYIINLALTEGLDAHAASVKLRLDALVDDVSAESADTEQDVSKAIAYGLNSFPTTNNTGIRNMLGMEDFRPNFGTMHERVKTNNFGSPRQSNR